MKRFVAATALFGAFTPAVAQTPPATPAPVTAPSSTATAKPAKPPKERMICETETEIGSRLATNRVCMTASQWKEHQLRTQGQLDQFHVNTQGKGGSGG